MVSGFLPRTACKVTDYLWDSMLFAFPFIHIFISPSKLMIRMNEVNHAYHRCLSYVWCNMLVRIILFFTCWINLWFAQNNSFVLLEQFFRSPRTILEISGRYSRTTAWYDRTTVRYDCTTAWFTKMMLTNWKKYAEQWKNSSAWTEKTLGWIVVTSVMDKFIVPLVRYLLKITLNS